MSDPTTREALAIAQDVLRGYGHDAIADAIEGYRPAHEVWQEGFKAGFDNMADIAEHFAAGGSIKTIRPPVENPYAAFPAPTEPLWEAKPDGRIGPSAAGERVWNAAAPTEEPKP